MTQEIKLQIKALRKINHVTQKELAEALHVSFQTISKWENGITMPDIHYLPELAKFFQVELEVLLGMKPLEEKKETTDFSSADYWENQLECTKNWKMVYFNDDYLEFLVTKVWNFEDPVHMLDCGCGYGYLAQKIFPYLPEGSTYTGIDVSDAFLEEGRRIFGEDNKKIRFIKGDIQTCNFQKKYDLIISQMLLCYLKNPETIIEKMMHALRPGGMLAAIDISLPLADNGFFLANGDTIYQPQIPNPEKVWKYAKEQGEMNYRMGTEMAYLFRQKGLKNIDARLSDKVFLYDGNSAEENIEKLAKYETMIKHLERFEKSYAYYLNRGCCLHEAEAYVKYQEDVLRILKENGVFLSHASCLYITWGFLGEQNGG